MKHNAKRTCLMISSDFSPVRVQPPLEPVSVRYPSYHEHLAPQKIDNNTRIERWCSLISKSYSYIILSDALYGMFETIWFPLVITLARQSRSSSTAMLYRLHPGHTVQKHHWFWILPFRHNGLVWLSRGCFAKPILRVCFRWPSVSPSCNIDTVRSYT